MLFMKNQAAHMNELKLLKYIYFFKNIDMKSLLAIAIVLISHSFYAHGQVKSLEPIPLDDAWKQKIYELAPDAATAPVSKKHKVLLFSLFTGYDHWVIPYADAVIEILSEKSGACEVVRSVDISMFEKKNLKKFDAVILNNNCSKGDHRDLFYDALLKNKKLSDKERFEKSAELESNLLSFVKKGGGLMALHGAIVMQNNSAPFSDMLGGSFDYHPPQQEVELHLVEADHPMTLAFEGKSFTHTDEPYFFKNAYFKKNYRPLLYMDVAKLQDMKKVPEDKIKYVSWIKRYGKGKVFYVSPSHNAQSYEDSRLLLFYLNGLQYVLGDFKCDDSPVN